MVTDLLGLQVIQRHVVISDVKYLDLVLEI